MLGFVLLQNVEKYDASLLEPLLQGLLNQLVVLGQKLIVAILVYIIGAWLISWLRKIGKRVLTRRKIDGAVASFINSLINTLLQLALVAAIISVLGIPTTSLAAIIAAGGLAVGMAMKDNLSNFAGGVMILLNKPFSLRDRILVQGMDGIVMEIGILYTVLLTGDGRTIYIPNGPLSTGTITNYSTQENRRIDIALNINYGNDIGELKEILSRVVDENEKVLKIPTPFVGITNINNGNFDLVIRAWASNLNYGTANTELNEAVYKALSDKGVFAPSAISVKMVD